MCENLTMGPSSSCTDAMRGACLEAFCVVDRGVASDDGPRVEHSWAAWLSRNDGALLDYRVVYLPYRYS